MICTMRSSTVMEMNTGAHAVTLVPTAAVEASALILVIHGAE